MIKNYTSGVPAYRSVQHIEDRLVQNGAKNIMKLYEAKKLAGVAFIIPQSNGTEMPFKLPARIERVEKRLLSAVKKPRASTKDRILEQAERTAWKILADWVDIQMTLVELDQAEIMEVFMPFIYNYKTEQTFFERMKETKFTLITDGKEKGDKHV